jgi:4'-phosphopantetheinyl transferase
VTARQFLWPATEHISRLEPDHVHVWAWWLDQSPTLGDWELLDAEESQRARRFVDCRDRDRFVRAHTGMRRLLGSYAQVAPAEIRFTKNVHGKPEIATPPDSGRIHFNLTHSMDTAVLAVSAEYALGVDIEAPRPIDSQVARKYFSAMERQTLQDLPPEMWLRGFFRCWTSKEALLKGEGVGLRIPLDSFDVEADPRRSSALLGALPRVKMRSDWKLLELQPACGITGTLAIQSGERSTTQCFTFVG